jgi:hypothetical protein
MTRAATPDRRALAEALRPPRALPASVQQRKSFPQLFVLCGTAVVLLARRFGCSAATLLTEPYS